MSLAAMSGTEQHARRLGGIVSVPGFLKTAHWLFTAVFLSLSSLVIAEMFGAIRWPGKPGWLEALLLLAATISTFASLSRQLPGQNVVLGATIIALLGSFVQAVGVLTGIPFGPSRYTEAAGPRLFGVLPWFIPLVWVVVVLNGRGVARLVLRPCRKGNRYGYWLLGLTAALCAAFRFGLEFFAARVQRYWIGEPTWLPLTGYGIPLADSLGWAVAVVVILTVATPALINKRPAQFPPDWHPLWVWTLLNLLFVLAEFRTDCRLAAVVSVSLTIITVFLALRGAKTDPEAPTA